IADMCNVELELGNWTFPAFDIPKGTTYDKELHRIAYEGIENRGIEKTKELTDRLDYELKVIKEKGYSVYFLIVGDLLRFARENNIFTTIRGSVAGSMTTFLLGITNVNPFEYKLPFERFLNPQRPSAPDIDMDFADNRRDEVLDYARAKYGEDKVAQIGTFGKMLAKGSVRDVARALGHPYSVGDKIANMIPTGSQGFPMTIERAIDMEPDLKKAYQKDPATKEIIDLAKKLEGGARHISVHAAGVVISPTPLYDFVPTQFDPKGGKIITQYDMHGVEDAGLIKFDFLGIRNLAILGDAVRLVKKFHGLDVDIEKIPVDDKKTFEMLARGETMGLFQLNGAGMTQHLKELKPTVIYDINAMVALYRPGPMESIPEYIKRKYNSRLITYLDPRLKDILDQSYGVITYQDDVMMIAIKLAGYSWLEADKLRKAMGKKIPKLMEEQKKKLLEGFVEHGLTKEKADKLWHLIEPFAAYGFNKAHAASYGRVAYQTAYMKANYPAEYMTAVLTAESGDTEKISEIISECKRMKIPVLPPNINESFGNFTVIKHTKTTEPAQNGQARGAKEGGPETYEKYDEGLNNEGNKVSDHFEQVQDQIRFGLYTIKNLGNNISNAIIDERKKNGKFLSFSNFLERIHHKDLNKKSLESLVKSGAMDDFEERGIMLGNIENALEYNKYIVKQQETDQSSLFGGLDESTLPAFRLKEGSSVTKDEMLSWEKELLGLYISGHPLDKHREKIEKKGATIKNMREKALEGTIVIVTGVIEESKEIMTKKGDRMAFVRIADFTGTLEVVVFPKIFIKYKNILEAEKCVIIKGKVSHRNGEVSILTEAIKEMEE
ncbi:MAG: DNA polymerase III subunit alpha, partial [Candidatus Pacebacteria bacterium]|nr:DNA polymerase III subunit alpha [Candidatus Paceibacterota bacterium]